jgi:hypothetical protein
VIVDERRTPHCETLCWTSVRKKDVEPFPRMSFGIIRDHSELAAASERERRDRPRSEGNLLQRDFQCSFKTTSQGDFNEFRHFQVSTRRTSKTALVSLGDYNVIIASCYSNIGEP